MLLFALTVLTVVLPRDSATSLDEKLPGTGGGPDPFTKIGLWVEALRGPGGAPLG